MNRTQRACEAKEMAGALLTDVKSAFNNISKIYLGRRMEALELESDLIRWVQSFMTDREVKLVLDGEEGRATQVDTGATQSFPAVPILLITHLSGVFDELEREVPGIRGLSFADDIAWRVEGGWNKR